MKPYPKLIFQVDSFTTVPNSPQSTRSILPFEKTNNHRSDGRLPSYHASNGTLMTARGWDGFATHKGQLGEYKPNYSTEVSVVFGTTRLGLNRYHPIEFGSKILK